MTISIKTDNAAFEGWQYEGEVARILRELANKIEKGERPTVVLDSNGNNVGTVKGY